ncbi:MAG: pyridoxal kinase [Dysgonomonas sp.]
MNKHIISIQSQVAHGYVGNNIAGLAIQLHGIAPIALPTVILSNPVDYKYTYGSPVEKTLFCDLLKGVVINQFIDQCDYLISGYCNSKDIISSISDFVQKTKTSKEYMYIYDPVCGDIRSGGLYIPKEIADYSITQLLPLSDIITPNKFELEYILKEEIETEYQLLHAVQAHDILKKKTVIATSMSFEDTPEENIEVVLIKDNEIKRFVSSRLPIDVVGTGDLFTAIVTSQLNLSKSIEQAIKKGITYLHAVLTDTYKQGNKELVTSILIKHMNILQ